MSTILKMLEDPDKNVRTMSAVTLAKLYPDKLPKDLQAETIYYIGLYYFSGREKYSNGLLWLHKAASMKFLPAMVTIGKVYLRGKEVKSDYPKAIVWLNKATNMGSAEAMYSLAHCYFQGKGVKRNYKKAMELLEKAGSLNFDLAVARLGFIYYEGEGEIKKDYQKAIYWCKKAAQLDNEEAMYLLGSMYFLEKEVQNYNEALKWFKKVKYIKEAKLAIGVIHYMGFVGKKDYKKAFHYFNDLKYSSHDAQYYLGRMYYNGEEVKRNVALAKLYLGMAIERGSKEAKKFLKEKSQK